MNRSDATVVTTRVSGSERRTIYEPRSDGRVDVVEKVRTKSGDWRSVGHEVADAVSVETPEGEV